MKRISFFSILGFACLLWLASTLGGFEVLELGLLDLRFKLRGAKAPHPDLVIVEIDDASIQRIGHWPWPRSYHATLLKLLSHYEPRLILYDVLFTEASLQPEEDELLAYTMGEAGNVIAAFFFHSEDPFIAFFPIPSIRDAARHLGYVNIFSDPDARIRRIRKGIEPSAQQGTPRYHHTSVVAALAGFSDPGEGARWLGEIPTDRENSFWINFPGPYSVFPRISFYQIIERGGTEDPELEALFRGKIVVVGHTATGGGDFRPTPFSSAYPGVGIQASAIHTLLTGSYLRRFHGGFLFAALLLLVPLVAFLTKRFPLAPALGAVTGLAVLYLIWNFSVFYFLGWILPVIPPTLALLGTFGLTVLFQFIEVRFQGELLAKELSLAARVQESFLPPSLPEIPGLDVSFRCQFAKVVGGDLYDWVLLGPRRLGIAIGDVSGKGVPASLYMARVMSEWRSLSKDFGSPAKLLEALNNRLAEGGTPGVFVTFLYLIFDLDSKVVSFSNAGHEPPFLYRCSERAGEWVKRASAQPLGLFSGLPYPEEKMALEEGDGAILISDGVRELRNPRREEWGLRGIAKALDSFPEASAELVIEALFRSMEAYARGNPAHDDRTLVCVRMVKGG